MNRSIEVWGLEEAHTLMESLSPFAWHNLATKDDIMASEGRIRAEFKAEMNEHRAEVKEYRAETKQQHADLVLKIAQSIRTVVLALLGFALAVLGMFLTLGAA